MQRVRVRFYIWRHERRWRIAELHAKWAFVTAGGEFMSDAEWEWFINRLPFQQFISLMCLSEPDSYDDG